MEKLNLQLFDAVENGNIQAMERLLDRGANPDTVFRMNGGEYSTTTRLEVLIRYPNDAYYNSIISLPILPKDARKALELLEVYPFELAQGIFHAYFWLLRNGVQSDPRFEARIISDYVR